MPLIQGEDMHQPFGEARTLRWCSAYVLKRRMADHTQRATYNSSISANENRILFCAVSAASKSNTMTPHQLRYYFPFSLPPFFLSHRPPETRD